MKRGLVVDDDVVFAQTLKRSLERRGLLVDIAHDGAMALAAARAHDFVLLDLKLGSESGLGLLAALRAALPQARIVLLTGFASIATAVEAIKRGADDYLAKPAGVAAILHAIEGDGEADEVAEDASPEQMLALDRVAWEHIQQAMRESEGNVSAAARLLGMHRRTLQRKLAKRPTPERGR